MAGTDYPIVEVIWQPTEFMWEQRNGILKRFEEKPPNSGTKRMCIKCRRKRTKEWQVKTYG